MKKLVLIDGNAILHRAYHALPPLTNSKGEPTNAVHGFFSMLLSIIESQKPEYLIVCFDRPKPTFRQTLFVGYQQHRPALADDFKPQIIMVHKILEKLKIPIFEQDGYEADDLIGTLSVEGKEKGLQVIILSGDRDLLQLVNSHVLMLAPITGISNMTLFDETKVKEKYGLKPSQIVDYKALVGDASDNYPGVTGIGPKTASDLLNKYGDLENLYKHISDLPLNMQNKLAQDAEQAAMAKKLATIIKDVPVKLEEHRATTQIMDKEGLRKVFQELNFKSLLNRFPKTPEIKKKPIKKEEDPQLDLL